MQEIFLQEKERLLSLPEYPWPTDERCDVSVGKTPYVRFDLNDYSVPHTHVCRILTVIGKPDRVVIHDGANIIAEHARSHDRGQQIEIEEHVRELMERKRQSRLHRGQNRLTRTVKCANDFLCKAAEHQYNIGSITAQLMKLLDRYGADELEVAMQEALTVGVPHPNTVRLSLERRSEEKNQPPSIPLIVSHDPRVREQTVRIHSLSNYDQLQLSDGEPSDDK